MTTARTDLDYLEDIIDEINRIHRMLDTINTVKQFANDEKVYYAVQHSLEIIGEAANRISQPLKTAHPTIPWRETIDLRNHLSHGYFSIDPNIVWGVIKKELTPLKDQIQQIIKQTSSNSETL